MKRRAFLQTVGGAVGVAAFGFPELVWANEPLEKVEGLPRRPLGKTGVKLSIVGFPGLALVHHEQEKCTAAVHDAFERGVNFFDVAPAYGNGQCETRLGIALQGLDRSKYFLACKTKKRDAEGCRKELENSLRTLKTDHFDLYQLHHLAKPSEVEEALGPNGAMSVILKAKEEGKIKHIGYSAHTTKAALAVMKGFRFDTVMFPINFVEYYTRGFGKEVLALANEQGCGVLAIKPLSWGAWPKDVQRTREWWYRPVEDAKDVELVLRFALSQKPVASALPPAFLDLLDQAIEGAKQYTPLDPKAVEQLKEMADKKDSIFIREEKLVAQNFQCPYPATPRSSTWEHLMA